MKKQINSVSSSTVKSILSATVLCAMLSATGVSANNYPSIDSNIILKDNRADPKTESGLIRGSESFTTGNSSENVNNEISTVIEQWMAESAFWNKEDSLSYDLQESVSKEQEIKSGHLNPKISMEKVPFIFNAENYISDSEF